MQTNFTPDQLKDPATANSEKTLRNCVHCGFCTATCPTYVLLGDELDSPRGRIYMIKDMLEKGKAPSSKVVKHLDRCLSCLSCMTTCPSGVNYMHLIDHARSYVEDHYKRPLLDRMIRQILAFIVPHPKRFRFAMRLAFLGRPFRKLLNRFAGLRPLAAMLDLAPRKIPARASLDTSPNAAAAPKAAKGRVAILQGCAEPVLKPEYQAAAFRLLERAGYEPFYAKGEGCCGALTHHMGKEEQSLNAARQNVKAWTRELQKGDLAAIVVTASGCGTTIKDYGFMLRSDPEFAEDAARVSALTKDITELLEVADLKPRKPQNYTVAYHPACSMQHGQQIKEKPKALLAGAGFNVVVPDEAHLCCGSAGVYNILQSELAQKLGDRKAEKLGSLGADLIATGNVGCAVQIDSRSALPVVHTVELLDWATGGPTPKNLSDLVSRSTS